MCRAGGAAGVDSGEHRYCDGSTPSSDPNAHRAKVNTGRRRINLGYSSSYRLWFRMCGISLQPVGFGRQHQCAQSRIAGKPRSSNSRNACTWTDNNPHLRRALTRGYRAPAHPTLPRRNKEHGSGFLGFNPITLHRSRLIFSSRQHKTTSGWLHGKRNSSAWVLDPSRRGRAPDRTGIDGPVRICWGTGHRREHMRSGPHGVGTTPD